VNILIFGGAGYIGSKIIRDLAFYQQIKNGTIRIIDNMFRERYVSLWDLPKNGNYEYMHADVRNEEEVEEVFKNMDAVIWVADITDAPTSFARKELTWETNHEAAVNIFKKAMKAKIKKYIYTSTHSIYGTTKGIVKEDTVIFNPASPYAESKLKAEKEIMQFSKENNCNTTVLRLGTVFGYAVGMRFDTVVNKFCYQASMNIPLTVHQQALKEGRPYIHVKDVSSAYQFVLENQGKTKNEVYNVAGQNANIQEVIDAIKRYIPDTKITLVPNPTLNQFSSYIDCSKIQSVGFKTQYSLDNGVMEMVEKFNIFHQRRNDK